MARSQWGRTHRRKKNSHLEVLPSSCRRVRGSHDAFTRFPFLHMVVQSFLIVTCLTGDASQCTKAASCSDERWEVAHWMDRGRKAWRERERGGSRLLSSPVFDLPTSSSQPGLRSLRMILRVCFHCCSRSIPEWRKERREGEAVGGHKIKASPSSPTAADQKKGQLEHSPAGKVCITNGPEEARQPRKIQNQRADKRKAYNTSLVDSPSSSATLIPLSSSLKHQCFHRD